MPRPNTSSSKSTGPMPAWVTLKRTPATISPITLPCLRLPDVVAGVSMISKVHTIKPAAIALKLNARLGPPTVIRPLASAGPTNWAEWKVLELSAIAAGISARGTRLGVIARRTGCQKAAVMPRPSASANKIQMVISPDTVSTVSRMAMTHNAAWVTVATMRRSRRSARTPPNGPRNRPGMVSAAASAPSHNAEPVNCQPSQPMATRTTHTPTTLGMWPII